MTLADVTDLVQAFALLGLGFYAHLMERAIRRQQEQLGRLTRRVWVLEGSPPCPCCDSSEVEA